MPTALRTWRLRSSRAHSDRKPAVEVQQCPLRAEVGEEIGDELARRKWTWKLMQTWSRRNWRRRKRRGGGGGGGQVGNYFKKLNTTENVRCLLVDLFGYQNKRSNQNSAGFRQGQVHPIPRAVITKSESMFACLNLATLHDKTCIISQIFLL